LIAQPQIARISVSGFIAEDRDQGEMLAKLAKDDAVKGVIVSINSTGGSTTGGEALYEGLRKLAAAKPTVATIGTVGASAAYMAAIATDHIVARRTSITGSIGVIFEYPEVSALLDKLGVKVEDIKSAPLKAEPDPFHPTSDEARAVVQGLVTDTYNWFVDIVAERRNIPRDQTLTLADGRIYTGQQALGAKLVDELGGEEAAVAWLGTKGVDAKLPVKDWEPSRPGRGPFSLSSALVTWLMQTTGLAPAVSPALIDRLLPDGLKLDGLLSVWQGSSGGDT
jgi:protease-4